MRISAARVLRFITVYLQLSSLCLQICHKKWYNRIVKYNLVSVLTQSGFPGWEIYETNS
jgi:hypothetical protein